VPMVSEEDEEAQGGCASTQAPAFAPAIRKQHEPWRPTWCFGTLMPAGSGTVHPLRVFVCCLANWRRSDLRLGCSGCVSPLLME
jgi:hypothetical protein